MVDVGDAVDDGGHALNPRSRSVVWAECGPSGAVCGPCVCAECGSSVGRVCVECEPGTVAVVMDWLA